MPKDNRLTLECSHLETAIRQELSSRFGEDCSDREITLADMARLNSALGAEDSHMTLHGYKISSLSPLAALTNMRSLFVNSSQIKDFSLLNELPGFCELDLGPSLLPPRNNKNLNKYHGGAPFVLYRPPTRVEGSEMEIEDLTPLCELKNLKALNISSLHKVTDLLPLAGMKNLRNLRLSGYSVTDYSPLCGLPKLEEVFLPFCQLTDPAPLAKLTNLKCLVLLRCIFSDQQIQDLAKMLPGCSLQFSLEQHMV